MKVSALALSFALVACGGSKSAQTPSGPPPRNFDRGGAAKALGTVDVQSCKQPDGPVGAGHIMVSFLSDGSVESAKVDGPPFAGTSTGACLERVFAEIRTGAFDPGPPIRVGKAFTIR